MKNVIYLDNGASTATYRESASEALIYMTEDYGNSSSPHSMGEKAFNSMKEARAKIAKEIGAKIHEIIFTSGGTEANNLALFGLARANKDKRKIIISSIEHSSIYEPAMQLRNEGYEVIEIPINEGGFIDMKRLEAETGPDTLLVSIIHANNEIGVIQDLREIGKLCGKKEIIFHTDAVQSFGKENINVGNIGADLLSASAHKIGGIKGIGFLYIKDGIDIKPLIIGGGQENGRRGGTENVPAIMAFARALEIIKRENTEEIKKIRDYFILELEKIGGKINGSKENRLYNNVNVHLPLDAEKLILYLSSKGIMCSTISACLSKQHKENRVLRALGLNKKEIDGSLRFGLSSQTTKKDIDSVLREIGVFLNKEKDLNNKNNW